MARAKREIDYAKLIGGKDFREILKKKSRTSGARAGLRRGPAARRAGLTEGFQNYESSIKFATSYIFVLFSSAVCGYFVGKEVFGLSFHSRMVLAVVCCYLTLMVEVFIFIIKGSKQGPPRRSSSETRPG